jgi:photosystem II stability/assembly factor-like uncharacterized protein
MFFSSKKRLLFFALCASLVSASTVFSQSAEQWRRLPGPNPEGASIEVIFSHGDSIFAGGHDGVFRSTDQGQSWKSVNLPETNPSITSSTAVGGTIFAGSSAWPIFRSNDNGLTWTRMEVPEDRTTFFPIAITALAAIGDTLVAGTKCESHSPIPCGIYRSTDNGKNWAQVGKGSILSIAVIGAELFAGGKYSAFRSSDLGANWTKINVSIATPHGSVDDIAYNVFAVMGNQIFVGTNYGVFVSTDRGMNWRPINRGLPSFSFSKDSGKYVKSFSEGDRKLITALAVIGDTLFAGDKNIGVFRFDNRSQSWTEVNDGLLNLNVNTFAVSGGKLFVGTEAGVWVTTDNGMSWKSANSGINGRHGVGGMVVRDNRLLVGAFGGVYASADNGNTWMPVKDSIEPAAFQIPPEWERGSLNKQVNHLAAINDVIIAGTDGGVFRSIDRGQNWEEASQGLPYGERGSLAPSINALTVIGEKIYAGVEDNGLFFSDDLGRSWTEASRDLRELTVKGLVSKGKKLFAATSDEGVFVSLDQGRHWKAAGKFFPEKEIFSLAGAGDNLLAWTTDGIYFSTNEGRSWMASETGLTAQYAYSFVVSGAKIFTETNNGLLVSTDQGRSWTKLSVIGEHLAIYALAASGGRLYAGTNIGVFLSTDDGRSWTQLGNIDFRYFSKDVYSLAVSGTRIVAGSGRGNIYLSPDLGKSWTMVNAGIDPPGTLVPGVFTEHTVVLNVSVDGAPRLIAGKDNGLFVSTNRGQTWRPTILAGQVATIKVIGSTIFAGGGFAGGGVLISRDNGLSWTPSNAGLDKENYVNAFAGKGGRIYLAGKGVYVSSDGGLSWTPINEGLTELDARKLVINDTHLFVTTYHGWLFARRL